MTAAIAGVGTRSRRHDALVHAPVGHLVSGAPAPRQTPSGAKERWASDAPITIALDGTLDALSPDAKDAARAAVGAWLSSGAQLPSIRFEDDATTVGAVQDGVSRVVVAPITLPGHEKDVAVTIAYADATTGRIVEADVILNSVYAFGVVDDSGGDDTAKCGGRYDVENILTHEMGHFLGLGEELSDQKATMYVVSMPCQTHKRKLTTDDVDAIDALYATPMLAGSSSSSGAPSGGASAAAGGAGSSSGSGSGSTGNAGGCGGSTAP